jgi:hypothetical protein
MWEGAKCWRSMYSVAVVSLVHEVERRILAVGAGREARSSRRRRAVPHGWHAAAQQDGIEGWADRAGSAEASSKHICHSIRTGAQTSSRRETDLPCHAIPLRVEDSVRHLITPSVLSAISWLGTPGVA